MLCDSKCRSAPKLTGAAKIRSGDYPEITKKKKVKINF